MMQVMVHILADLPAGKLQMSFDRQPGHPHTGGNLIIAHFLLGCQQIYLPLPAGQPRDSLVKQKLAFPLLYMTYYLVVQYGRQLAKLRQMPDLHRMSFQMIKHGIAGEDKKIIFQAAYIVQQMAAVPYPDIHLLHDLTRRLRVFDINHHRIVQSRIGLVIQPAKGLLIPGRNQRQ